MAGAVSPSSLSVAEFVSFFFSFLLFLLFCPWCLSLLYESQYRLSRQSLNNNSSFPTRRRRTQRSNNLPARVCKSPCLLGGGGSTPLPLDQLRYLSDCTARQHSKNPFIFAAFSLLRYLFLSSSSTKPHIFLQILVSAQVRTPTPRLASLNHHVPVQATLYLFARRIRVFYVLSHFCVHSHKHDTTEAAIPRNWHREIPARDMKIKEERDVQAKPRSYASVSFLSDLYPFVARALYWRN